MQKFSTLAEDAEQFERRILLKRHIDGDERAFAELIGRYRRQVYSYLVRTGVEASERDDLFQDIFVKVHRNAHRYDPARALEPWLFTIVANTVRSHYRKHRLNGALGEAAADIADERQPDSEAQAHAKETLEWLESIVRTLPIAQREVFLLCSFTEMSQKDVAEVLGLPVGTVKTHLSRTRLEIARALARRKLTIRREVLS